MSPSGTPMANAPAWRMAAAGTPFPRGSGVAGSGLVADPDYRIVLSDPRVKEQARASKAKLEELYEKLKAVHGEDAEASPRANTVPVPFAQEEILLLQSTVEAAIAIHKAPVLSAQVIQALKNLFDYLASMQTMAKTLQIIGLLDVLTQAVEGLNEFLVALGAL